MSKVNDPIVEIIKTHKFDSSVEYGVKQNTLGAIVDYIISGKIILDRQKTKKWDRVKRSCYIETILLNLPNSFIFFRADESYKFKIIDGYERICAIKEFFIDGACPFGFEKLRCLNGISFLDYEPGQRRQILNQTIYTFIVNNDIPEYWDKDIRDRLNPKSNGEDDPNDY